MKFIPIVFYGKYGTVITPTTPTATDTSLAIWLDAADSTVFTPNSNNGTNITQWADKAGISHNATPLGNTATRPTVTTNFQNGKTVLYFDGGDGLASNMSSTLQSLSGSTVFVVGKATATGSAGQEQHFIEGAQIQGNNYTPLNAYSLIMSGSYGYNLFFAGGQAKSTTTLDTNFHIHTIVFSGSGATNADKLKHRIDGVNQTLTFASSIGSTTSAAVNALVVGAQGDNTLNLTGYIGEVIVYTRTLTTSEINNTEAYLKNKWNL